LHLKRGWIIIGTKKIIFFDRDGVININHGYIYKKEDFVFIDGVIDIMIFLKNLNYEFILVTNQSGINRGYYSKKDFKILTQWMKDELNKKGISFLDIKFCPHKPEDNCLCRKPKAYMITQSIKKWNVNINKSYFIGDSKTDMIASKLSKISSIYFNNKSKFDNIEADYYISSLYQIKDIITK
jgi:D-glycero-D-manno-heptose 1,7-bisphosphate phosphatase